MDDIRNLLSRSIGAHIELRVNGAGDLPAIVADRGQVEQVLLNLAINARDAMPRRRHPDDRDRASPSSTRATPAPHPGASPGRYVELAVARYRVPA